RHARVVTHGRRTRNGALDRDTRLCHATFVKTAREWKDHYARERASLGPAGLDALLDRAAAVALDARDAWVFPHTSLAESGTLVAAVARALVASGTDEVLALGVLHGARERDRDLVQRARAGDPDAVHALRGVHAFEGHA